MQCYFLFAFLVHFLLIFFLSMLNYRLEIVMNAFILFSIAPEKSFCVAQMS